MIQDSGIPKDLPPLSPQSKWRLAGRGFWCFLHDSEIIARISHSPAELVCPSFTRSPVTPLWACDRLTAFLGLRSDRLLTGRDRF